MRIYQVSEESKIQASTREKVLKVPTYTCSRIREAWVSTVKYKV